MSQLPLFSFEKKTDSSGALISFDDDKHGISIHKNLARANYWCVDFYPLDICAHPLCTTDSAGDSLPVLLDKAINVINSKKQVMDGLIKIMQDERNKRTQ